jgi:NADH-quinone oxidoreductase subunit C
MSADAKSALQAKFPQVTDRASLDHPAVNVPMGDLIPVLKSLRDEGI